jgi:hypothetical protein
MELEGEKKKSRECFKLEELRMELGEFGGAGHYFGKDQLKVRDSMEEEGLKKVLELLSLGEKKVNLKEREFRVFVFVRKKKKRK